MPEKVFQHHIKPTTIPGEPALVLLGTDFLSKFDEFCVDWTNNRIKLGDDWVYLTNTVPESSPILDIEATLPHKQRVELETLLGAHTGLFVHNPRVPKEATIATHVIRTKSSLPHKSRTSFAEHLSSGR